MTLQPVFHERSGTSREIWARQVTRPLLFLLAILCSCQRDPADFAQQFDLAVDSGRSEAVAQFLTVGSRPLFRALCAVRGTAKNSPAALGPRSRPTKLVNVQGGENTFILTVSAGPLQRDWVLVKEEGEFRLDLFATASRRPWDAAASRRVLP